MMPAIFALSKSCMLPARSSLSARNRAMGPLPDNGRPSTSNRGSCPVGVLGFSSDSSLVKHNYVFILCSSVLRQVDLHNSALPIEFMMDQLTVTCMVPSPVNAISQSNLVKTGSQGPVYGIYTSLNSLGPYPVQTSRISHTVYNRVTR